MLQITNTTIKIPAGVEIFKMIFRHKAKLATIGRIIKN